MENGEAKVKYLVFEIRIKGEGGMLLLDSKGTVGLDSEPEPIRKMISQ